MNLLVKFICSLINIYLKITVSDKKIKNYIKSLNIKKQNTIIDRKNLIVATAQVKIKIFKSVKDYIKAMNNHIEIASKKNASLICFPEENGLLLLGIIPFIKNLFKESNNEEKKGKSIDVDIKPIVKALTPYLKNTFISIFGELSKEYGMFIMAGSIPLVLENKLYNQNFMFGPSGELLGTQSKAHLVKEEVEFGFSAYDKFKVLDTAIGKIGFPVCMDATYYETFKILKKLGAEIVIIPIANMEEYDYHLALRGIWPRVSEANVYGLKSSLVGTIGQVVFTGKAGIFAPVYLIKSGVIKEAMTFNEEETIVGPVNLDELKRLKSVYFSDTNVELYRKYENELLKPCASRKGCR